VARAFGVQPRGNLGIIEKRAAFDVFAPDVPAFSQFWPISDEPPSSLKCLLQRRETLRCADHF